MKHKTDSSRPLAEQSTKQSNPPSDKEQPAMFAKYKITHLDGTVIEAPGRKVDAVKFERQFKMPVSNLFEDGGIYTEHLWYFGWCAEKRVNADIPVFDDWMETVEGVDIVTEEEEEESPTDPSSSPSL
jgi:hypothetical protein